MKKNKRVAIGCNITAAVCFGIVSYGHFYRVRIGFGWIFALLTIAQLALALTNYCSGRAKTAILRREKNANLSRKKIATPQTGCCV